MCSRALKNKQEKQGVLFLRCALLSCFFTVSNLLFLMPDFAGAQTFIQMNKVEKNPDEVQFSREDLEKENPDPFPGLASKIKDEVVVILKAVGSSSDSNSKISRHRSVNSRTDYFLLNATGSSPTTGEANPDDLRSEFRKASSNAFIKTHIEQSLLWQKIREGVNFDLDFGMFFGRKGSPQQQPEGVRYGLLLESIDLKNDPGRLRAGIGSSLSDEIAFANKADVKWTIGPIDRDNNKKDGNQRQGFDNQLMFMTPEEREKLSDEELAALEEQEKLAQPVDQSSVDNNFWLLGGVPRPVFKSNLKPTSTQLSSFSQNKKIGMKFTLTQVQGLYQFETTTPDGNKVKKQFSEHQFKLPIFGTLAVGRRYDENMQVIYTSAYGVLVSKRAPKVSVHYYEQTKQYVADGELKTEDETSITMKYHSDANVSEKEKTKRSNQRGYELGLKKSF